MQFSKCRYCWNRNGCVAQVTEAFAVYKTTVVCRSQKRAQEPRSIRTKSYSLFACNLHPAINVCTNNLTLSFIH